MLKFYDLLKDLLFDQEKTFEELEKEGIIAERSFYQYKQFTPYLPTILKILNYLKSSIDYLANRTFDNKFKKYDVENINFYINLIKLLKDNNISQSKISRDLQIGRSNFTYWKQGVLPKFETLILIADYLGVSIEDLIR